MVCRSAGSRLVASAVQHDLTGRFDARQARICGIGSVVTEPAYRGRGHARALIETLVARATAAGADLALLCAPGKIDDDNLPPVVPIVNLMAGLRFKLVDQLSLQVELGWRFPAFFAGAGVGYFF